MVQAKEVHQTDFTIKIEHLQYQGLLGQQGNIKIEIDHFQNVLLPGITTDYKNAWRVNVSPLVMDKREICAEKIRVPAQRASTEKIRTGQLHDHRAIFWKIDRTGNTERNDGQGTQAHLPGGCHLESIGRTDRISHSTFDSRVK